MSFLRTTSGLLGMNARNLKYIARFNSHANKKFADNKLFTKQFLSSRNIGVAKLYDVVSHYRELTPKFFENLPDSFVLKPNRGFGGAGILVITGRKKNAFITASGRKVDMASLYRNCIEILEGKYSISGVHDKVIFEERLEVHPDFRKLTDSGLPDIRVIVFNLVPVMAMARIPTYESEGKANMELGAIALGIDIGTGKTVGGCKKTHPISKTPNGHNTKGFQIPHWNEILQTVANIQHVTKIGFLGVDLVVTKEGVKVLEINARPGLKIQVANRIPLGARLKKIGDIKVHTPEEGVEIAKTLFSEKSAPSSASFQKKPVIGVQQPVLLNKAGKKPQQLLAHIDSLASENTLHETFYDGKVADLSIAGKRLKLPVKKGETAEADIVLAAKFLSDFYIDPNKTVDPSLCLITDNVDEKMINNIDEKICEIDERIKLLSYINPQNIQEQRELFLANPEFDPRFSYREVELDAEQIRRDLKRIPKVDHLMYPLFTKKIKELEQKVDLIESVGHKDFSRCSQALFGKIGNYQYRLALDFIQQHKDKVRPDESPELELKEASELMVTFLKKYKLGHWSLKVIEDSVVDIQVTKRNTILLRKGATFQENRLKALLAHEIGTHVFRFENGKRQNFRIFQRGTAGYLRTEEGLAVWNQNQLGLDLGDKFLVTPYQIVAIHMAQNMSFHDLFHYMKDTYELNEELAWRFCLKTKRGLVDTSQKGAFTKDALYFLGYRDIQQFFKKGGAIEDLYVGKISIDDLETIQKLEDLHPPKFLFQYDDETIFQPPEKSPQKKKKTKPS